MDAAELPPATLTPAGSRWVLTFAVDLPVSRWDAWIAVTTRDGLGAWFPARIQGEWRQDSGLMFTFDEEDEVSYGRVVDAEIGFSLAFTWEEDSVRLKLEEYDAGTRLTFAASIDAPGRAARDAAGWHASLAALRESVGGYVEETDQDVRHLFAMYEGLFGQAAATDKPPSYDEGPLDPSGEDGPKGPGGGAITP
ncbi:SRPBCC domain-containing protein [Zhihengliuella flava]|uniref:Uncharacterized protein YndB with AHSA1/START domain n=1 Tax=Zhihengliuella flava TaxID=1285193 RepID=A0A931GEK1_9MICC|nr:SRPBCC domain-containing protein [Zhihengliuella flava]MBG6084200.1 uncharacterized protein YndB with AHSA1/START domain [Zhihengliuella flava]